MSDDNAFGFTEVNGDEQFIQIHDDLNENDYITTLMHELVHVVQNENGQFDDEERENEAYSLESILFNQFTAKVCKHVTPSRLKRLHLSMPEERHLSMNAIFMKNSKIIIVRENGLNLMKIFSSQMCCRNVKSILQM